MKAKITALVSGILALALDILMIAADFAAAPILIFILILVAIAALVAAIVDEKRNVVTLVETRANGKRPVDNALKLANEVAPYIKVSDGRIYLKVVKQK